MSRDDELPQRTTAGDALEEARRLWQEAECDNSDLRVLHRCLDGLRALDARLHPGAPAAVSVTGPQDQVDRVIQRWRAEHEPAGTD